MSKDKNKIRFPSIKKMQARVERILLRFLSKASGNVESVGKSDCRLPVSRWTSGRHENDALRATQPHADLK